jgi:hypothetical protein
MNKTNIRVGIRILGEVFNIEEVTKCLEIVPTRAWYKGDSICATRKKYSCTGWNYYTEQQECLDIRIPLEELERLFLPKLEILFELKKKYGLKYVIEIVPIIENGETPGIVFSNPLLQFCAQLDATIDVDIYVN